MMQSGGLRRRPLGAQRSRRGMLLILVLVVVVALAFSAYTFTSIMQAEQEVAQMTGRRVQSRYLVDSGADAIRLFLSTPDDLIMDNGGTYDNATQFQALSVFTDPAGVANGQVTVIAPGMDDSGTSSGFRYGLMDESSKLNLNILPQIDAAVPGGGQSLLLALPGMTEDIADAIMDWIDTDEDTRDFGAENDYYQGLSPPYAAKNGPLDSIEELLLVRGVTPELLFGADDNHNGVLDETELAGVSERGLDPELSLGWSSLLTLWSKERNLSPEGLPRINLNNPDLMALSEELSAVFNGDWVQFIIAMRLFGPYTGGAESTGPTLTGAMDYGATPVYDFSQILDLVDARVQVEYVNEDEPAILDSPFQTLGGLALALPLLLDNATVVNGDVIPGRININQCSRTLMLGIPGMTEELADSIISQREVEPGGVNSPQNFETWLLVEGLVSLDTMRQLLPFVCAGGDVYKAELVGYFDDGVASSRAEVVIDRTEPFPRIVFWRDKSHLPLGYSLGSLGIASGTLQ